MNTIEMNLVV